MKLTPPIRDFKWKYISQLFGVNKAVYEPRFGIPGHNGIDIVPPNPYGQKVVAAHDGTVTQLNKDDPTRKNGNGLWIQGWAGDEYVQTAYWHLSSFNVIPGQQVKAGDCVGFIGNTGFVFPAPSDACPQCGSHLHFAVSRLKIFPGNNTEFIPTDYKTFCDPTQGIFTVGDKLPIKFNRNLYYGCSGDDVSWLQTILKIEGLAKDYEPIGYFGGKTMRDVVLFQKKHNITPSFGFVGPITRSKLSIYCL